MSLSAVPNWNSFIDRIADILTRSSEVMPKTNGSTTKNDLVNEIVKYTFPLAEQTPNGAGPPHIFINRAENPVIRRQKIGRDSINEHGPEKWTLEFYVVSVVLVEHDPMQSQEDLYNLTQAIMNTLGKNRRLLDKDNLNPLAYHLETVDVPYNLRTDEASLKAHNVLVRPDILVNLRP